MLQTLDDVIQAMCPSIQSLSQLFSVIPLPHPYIHTYIYIYIYIYIYNEYIPGQSESKLVKYYQGLGLMCVCVCLSLSLSLSLCLSLCMYIYISGPLKDRRIEGVVVTKVDYLMVMLARDQILFQNARIKEKYFRVFVVVE